MPESRRIRYGTVPVPVRYTVTLRYGTVRYASPVPHRSVPEQYILVPTESNQVPTTYLPGSSQSPDQYIPKHMYY